MYSLHFTVYIYENVQFTLYSLHCTVYILFYENENQFTFDIYKMQMYSSQTQMYSLQTQMKIN